MSVFKVKLTIFLFYLFVFLVQISICDFFQTEIAMLYDPYSFGEAYTFLFIFKLFICYVIFKYIIYVSFYSFTGL